MTEVHKSHTNIICPKCQNCILFAELKDLDGSLSNEKINKYLDTARHFDKCFYVIPFPEKDKMMRKNPGLPLLYRHSPPQCFAIFCRCGFYSLNYLDFPEIKNTKAEDSNERKIRIEKEIFYLREQIYNLQQKTKILSDELIKANQIINNLNNDKNKGEYEKYNINDLYSKLKIKDKEINELKLKLSNNSGVKKYVDFNNIIVVHFISTDQKINCGIKCLKTDTFAEVEEQLYKTYKEYRETNNTFVSNGKAILRFKKIYENNINDNDKVQLLQFNTTNFY